MKILECTHNTKIIDYEGGDEPQEGRWVRNALFRAIDKENIEIVNLLLNKKEIIDIDSFNYKYVKDPEENEYLLMKTSFYRAIEKENVEIISALMKYDFDINLINCDCAKVDGEDVEYPLKEFMDDIEYGDKTAL